MSVTYERMRLKGSCSSVLSDLVADELTCRPLLSDLSTLTNSTERYILGLSDDRGEETN